MATPVLSEPAIMYALERKVCVEELDVIRTGALLALIDGHDRKVLREPYVDLAQAAQNLQNLTGRIYAYSYVLRMLQQKTLTEDKLTEILAALTATAEAQRHKLLTTMTLVVQCPYDDDTRH